MITGEKMAPLTGYQIRDDYETSQEIIGNIGDAIDKMGNANGIFEISDIADAAGGFISDMLDNL